MSLEMKLGGLQHLSCHLCSNQIVSQTKQTCFPALDKIALLGLQSDACTGHKKRVDPYCSFMTTVFYLMTAWKPGLSPSVVSFAFAL